MSLDEALADIGGVLGDFSVAAAAVDLGNFFELNDIARADLVGFNLGGLVALRAAAEFPDTIARLVLISTNLVPPVAKLKSMRRLAGMMPKAAFTDQPKDVVLKAMDGMIAADMGTDLTLVKAPLLFVAATGDPTAAQAIPTLQAETQAQIARIEASTPDLLTEQPQKLAALIEDFTPA